MAVSEAQIQIGTSGWLYPHWSERFYPSNVASADRLAFYAERFSTVEVNSTFYRLPLAETIESWRSKTPNSFLFSCKISQFVSHRKKLREPGLTLPPFLERIRALGPKLGPILVQLPPRWHVNEARLTAFLNELPRDLRFAFEFRDRTWWTDEVFQLLRRHNAAFCHFDLGGTKSPPELTADFIYFRMHGPRQAYRGSYGDRVLQSLARSCLQWQAQGVDIYGYFDNDENAHAVRNAMRLKTLLETEA